MQALKQTAPPSTPFQNPYVCFNPSTGSINSISNQVSKMGRFMEETSSTVWNHFKTSSSVVETTLGKLNKGTKFLLAGGYENVFKEAFEVAANEKLLDSFACFLSTSAHPIAGQLFISTHRFAFLSDQPISFQDNLQSVSSHYKVMVPWSKVLTINAFKNPKSNSEKYIQIVTIEFYEFWFMGFYNHDKAMKELHQAKLQSEIKRRIKDDSPAALLSENRRPSPVGSQSIVPQGSSGGRGSRTAGRQRTVAQAGGSLP
ncbi:hypothetical protein GOP47_0019957 [Adiantum capillus-veneris]|uniref:GRAM domain-containing protein n=1 Tax=Adiantum capillus-veneris TaxID=13818 RepID=A0A9D4UCS1_ADICA|nr:hypothetical protein GOP47_0019957 [Adiantum capillus-veneris]